MQKLKIFVAILFIALVAILVAIFAINNNNDVLIEFWGLFSLPISSGFALILAFIVGVITMALASAGSQLILSRRIKRLQNEILRLQQR